MPAQRGDAASAEPAFRSRLAETEMAGRRVRRAPSSGGQGGHPRVAAQRAPGTADCSWNRRRPWQPARIEPMGAALAAALLTQRVDS